MSEEDFDELQPEADEHAELFAHIRLFDKWSFEDIEINDPRLHSYMSLRPVFIPYSGGRHQKRRFKKAEVNIVERFVNKLMSPGRNSGKKQHCMRATEVAFDMIHSQTGLNPIQVLVSAIVNAAPREETTRVTFGGIAQHQSVDVSPSRRVDVAIRYLAKGIRESSFSSIYSFDESIATELIKAGKNDPSSVGVRKKQEIERIALAAR